MFTQKIDLAIYIIFFLIAVLYLYVLFHHIVFGEWDGIMQYYSGMHIIQNGKYIGWASHFWPPLHPFLLGIGKIIFKNPFFFGKLITFISGMVTLYFVYLIAYNYLYDKIKALLVVTYIFSVKYFFIVFTLVENHNLETVFFIGAIYYYIKYEKKQLNILLFISGILTGFAGLSRYTSYTLVLSLILYIIFTQQTNKLKKLVIYLSGFLLVSLIWWIPNFFLNGSPLATWQYLNIGEKVYPKGEINWLYDGQNNFNNLKELIFAYPKEFIFNFIKNLILSITLFIKCITSNKYVSVLFIIIFLYSLIKKKFIYNFLKENKLYIFILMIYVVLCSTAFVFPEALYPVILLFTMMILLYLVNLQNGKIFILIFVLINLFFTYEYSINFLLKDRKVQLSDLYEVNSILLKEKNRDIIISSINPARGYYSKLNWIMFPLGNAKNICDIIELNYSRKVINYLPKIPVDLNLTHKYINYLIITKDLPKYYSFINDNLTINQKDCKKYNLILIYKSKNTALYKVVKK
jgi:hypothetical protein